MRDPAFFFQPAIYEHAAAVIDKTPWQVSRDEELLVSAHAAAYERYHHTPITVGIDIYNLEAEAYGAVVDPTQGFGIPTITKPLFKDAAQLLTLAPMQPETDGRLAMFVRAGQRLQQTFPEADVRIPVSGPFSMASILLGFEAMLLASMIHPEVLQIGLLHLAELQSVFLQAIHQAGLKPTLFESAATPPLISPELFHQVELPALKKLVALVQQMQGTPPALIMGGDTALLVQDLCSIGAGYLICPPETDQALFMQQMVAFPEIMIRINMQSGVVSAGTRQEIEEEVNRVLRLADGRKSVCIGTGVVPYETPMENIFYISELLQQHA